MIFLKVNERIKIYLDDIETGVGDQIPLWLFGFLY